MNCDLISQTVRAHAVPGCGCFVCVGGAGCGGCGGWEVMCCGDIRDNKRDNVG